MQSLKSLLNRSHETETPEEVEITRQNRQENLSNASLILYLGGMTVFLAIADFDIPWWSKAYYIWNMLLFVLLFAASLPRGALARKVGRMVLLFTIIRFLWEIAAAVFGQNINHSLAVDILFYLCLSIILIISAKDLLRWMKQK